MRKYLVILALPLLILAQACKEASNQGEATTLAFRFPPGTVYAYLLDSHQTIEQEMMGQKSEIRQTMQLLSTHQVEKGPGDNKKVTVVFDRFYIKSVSANSEMEYDSADSTKQPKELDQIGGIVNKPFSITVDDHGKIVSIDAAAARTIATPLNDSTIRRMMQQSLNVYPTKPVKPGDTWQTEYVTNMGFMDMLVNSEYKLLSVVDGVANVEINATIKSVPSDNPQMKGMDIEMTGTQSGTMEIDVKSGLINASKFKQEVSGNMKIPGEVIPMTLSAETRMIGKMK